MVFIKRLIILFSLLVLVACAGEGEDQSSKDKTDSDTIVVDLISDATSLDPHAANDGNSLYVMNTIYDNLVAMNKDLEIEPALAERLEQIEPTIWEAKLREDVVFHDDSKLDAKVVKANLDRVLDPEVASPLAFLFDMIEEVEVIDKYSLQIKTKEAFAALPLHLAHPGGHIISQPMIDASYEALEAGDDPFAVVNDNAVGSGYFKFEERSHGESVDLVKNEAYWGVEASTDHLKFKVVPEDLTRIAELTNDDAQVIYPVNANDRSEVDANDSTRIQETESASLSYLGINTEVQPFTDKKVRQAIAYAVDSQAIVDGVTDGIAIPAKGPLAPTVFGHNKDLKGRQADLEKAKELLKEAGFEDGFETSILVNDRTTADIAELIQEQLEAIGIKADINQLETGAYLDASASGNTELFMAGWGTVTLDADYGLYPMFHSQNKGAPGNRSFYENKEVDQLLEKARSETDERKRQELYFKAQDIIVDEAPIVPIYHTVFLTGLSEEIEGYFQYPSSFPFLRDVKYKEK